MNLRKVTQKDTGEYRCEVSAPLDRVKLGETNVTLKVLGRASTLGYSVDAFILFVGCILGVFRPALVRNLVNCSDNQMV